MRVSLMDNFSSMSLSRVLSFSQNGSAYLFALLSRYFLVVVINGRFSSIVTATD